MLFLFEQLVSKQGKLPFFGMIFNQNYTSSASTAAWTLNEWCFIGM